MAGKLVYTLVVRHPDTLVATALLAGSELPDWATDLVDPGNLDDGSAASGDDKGYADMSPAELKDEVEKRNDDREDDDQIEVTGTGASGNVLKADLIAALEADDADNA